jgi:cell division protein FtsB
MDQDLPNSLGEITAYAIELGDDIESVYRENWIGLSINRSIPISVKPNSSINRLEFSFSFRISRSIDVPDDKIQKQIENIPGDPQEWEIKQDLQERKYENIKQEQIKKLESEINDLETPANTIIKEIYADERGESYDGFVSFQFVYPQSEEFGLKKYDQVIMQIERAAIPVLESIYDEIDELEDGFDEDDGEDMLQAPDHHSYQ